MRLIVATHNKHKMEEIKQHLEPYFDEVVDLIDLGFEAIDETGSTFYDNAKIKADTILQHYPGDAVLADDSGICIVALEDQPGVYSARFLGEETPSEVKNQEVLRLLEHQSERRARFVCCMVYLEAKHEFMTQQEVVGVIASEAKGEKGFGYDPLFIPWGYEETFAENPEIKQRLSHRTKALNEVIKHVQYFKK